MILKLREKEPKFYEILDSLMLSTYEGCSIKYGKYVFQNKHLIVDIRPRAFYLHLDPKKYSDPVKFNKNGSWSYALLKCGFKLTASTGSTYSYPGLRDYIGTNDENDTILRASYYFACVSQIMTFFSQKKGDIGFIKLTK